MLENKNTIISNRIAIIAAFLILVGGIGYGVYEYYMVSENLESTKRELSSTEQELNDFKANSQTRIAQLDKELSETEHDNALLQEALQNERDKNEAFQNTIEDITDKLEDFERLNELDPEILKKYSKVYFLSEHYVPASLTLLEKRYMYDENQPVQIHSEVKPFLVDLIQGAANDDIELYVKSGYRSFGVQSNLKNQYVVQYGSGTANSFSAEQGYSEHQLGTTVDFITTGIGGTVDAFGTTEAYQWLLDNAHKYGFVLSYPENNTYYRFEPWHWRFVGQELATYLHRNNMNFYDMDQRDIDEYLLNIFE